MNDNFSQFTPIDFPDEENVSDVRDYIIHEFEGMNIDVSVELVSILQEKSEGTFLYPEMVFRDLKKNSFKIDDIRNLPSGVINYIHQQFDRLFGSDIKSYKREIRPMLGFILTSCEPIARSVLKYGLEIRRDSELDDRLEMLGTFFIQSGSADEDTVVPFHKSVIDYCFDKDISGNYYVYPEEAKEDFANRGLELYKSGALQWTTRTDEKPDTLQRYFLTWLPSHLMNANMTKEAATVLSDFAFLMKRLRFGNVERVILDYFLFRGKLGRISKESDSYFDVICSAAHYLRRNCKDNPAYKTMLQIATEIADECPVTQAAERWLNPETGDSPCDWFWLNKVKRPKEYLPNPCKMVIENAGNSVKLLSNGDALSWGTNDNNLRIWDLETGVCKAVLEGHSDLINGAKELSSGDILSWSYDHTLRLWSLDGNSKSVLKGHSDYIDGAIELNSGYILSWCNNYNNDCKDHTMRLWSSDGTCKKVLNEHDDNNIVSAIELSSGDILSWSENDATLHLWSPDGTRNGDLEGHSDDIFGAIELHSGDILSWSWDDTLRRWSLDGNCQAVMEGHEYRPCDAIELSTNDILSWTGTLSDDNDLRLWSPDGTCKATLKGHTHWVRGAIELKSKNILSWSDDHTMRLWSLDGLCKSILEGHAFGVDGVLELRSGDILSWSSDKTLRLWSSDGTCKAVLNGHTSYIVGAVELSPDKILSWSWDNTIRIWNLNDVCKFDPNNHQFSIRGALELKSGNILFWSFDRVLHIMTLDGVCKTFLEEHTGMILGALELESGIILSWSNDYTLRLWTQDGIQKTALVGHKWVIKGALELRSGDILSWSYDCTMRIWSTNGNCKAILNGINSSIEGVIELCSGDILLWSDDETMRIWSPDGKSKVVLKGHTGKIRGALELCSGDLLSWSADYTFRLWSPDGTCKAVVEDLTHNIKNVKELAPNEFLFLSFDDTLSIWSSDGICKEEIMPNNPQYDSYYSLFFPKQVHGQFYSKRSSWGINLQHIFNSIARWNSPSCDSRFIDTERICIWYGNNLDFLQLNYGNHMSISFKQADQFLAGEIDESQLVTYVPEPKGTAIPKTE